MIPKVFPWMVNKFYFSLPKFNTNEIKKFSTLFKTEYNAKKILNDYSTNGINGFPLNIQMKKQVTFDEFKKKIKSFEEFKESSAVKIVCENNKEKISKAYEEYCLCQYNRYKDSLYGGNSSKMV